MDVLKRVTGLVLTLPPNPRNASKETFPSYNNKGLLNARFRREGYHLPYPIVGDLALIAWSNKDILGEEGGGGGGE